MKPVSTRHIAKRAHAARVVSVLAALGSAACGNSPLVDAGDASADVSDADEAAVDTFMPADHTPFPQVPNQGGAIIAHPALTVVTFANDPNRDVEEAFGQWIVGSNWLATVGADYGIGSATALPPVRRAENAPLLVTSAQIEDTLAQGLMDGSIPTPAGGLSSAIYLVLLPQTSNVTLVGGNGPVMLCHGILGGHFQAHRPGLVFEYIVEAFCASTPPGLTPLVQSQMIASHEIIEAATDPDEAQNPAWTYTNDSTDPWVALGGEVADMCSYINVPAMEGGFAAQRIWSNGAAAAGTDPCVPADPSQPLYGVTASPDTIQTADAGSTLTYLLSGWSSAPVADWRVSIQTSATFFTAPRLSGFMVGNGGTVTLTVPTAAAASGGYGFILVTSSSDGGVPHQWPVTFVVQ